MGKNRQVLESGSSYPFSERLQVIFFIRNAFGYFVRTLPHNDLIITYASGSYINISIANLLFTRLRKGWLKYLVRQLLSQAMIFFLYYQCVIFFTINDINIF